MDKYKEAWEKVLRESEFAWWEWDIVRNTVKFNDLKAVLLGYHPDHFRGRGFRAFTERVHPEDYEKTMEAMRAVLRGETKLYQVDYRIRTIRGNYLWFMDRGIIMQDDGNGKPLKIRGIVIDLGKESERGTDIDALLSVIYRSGTRAAGKYSFITVCSLCHRIKKEDDQWIYLPEGLSELIGERISHGICSDCMKKLYPDIAGEVLKAVDRNSQAAGSPGKLKPGERQA